MNEQYVTYQTAKLLKEKGFDWECNHYYMENISGDEHYLLPGSIMYGEDYNKQIKLNELGVNINTSSCKISAPTQQMACRWLREEKGIHPELELCTDNEFSFTIYKLDGKRTVLYEESHCWTNSEDAVEAALEYVLKNLI